MALNLKIPKATIPAPPPPDLEQVVTAPPPSPTQVDKQAVTEEKAKKAKKEDAVPPGTNMEAWTAKEWANLESATRHLLKLQEQPAVNNKKWRQEVRVCIQVIAAFRYSEEPKSEK